MKSSSLRSSYFTIVEMLIIISIIVILAAILMPALARTRERARETACANNLHQICLAYHAYQADYKKFPLPYRWLDDFSPIYPYERSLDIFTCPNRMPIRKLQDESDLIGNTDYYVNTMTGFEDIELKGGNQNRNRNQNQNGNGNNGNGNNGNNSNGNNGHGNNDSPYDIDPSNPVFERVFADKLNIPAVYDRYGPAHLDRINIANLSDSSVETMDSMNQLWTLKPNGDLFLDSVTQWPEMEWARSSSN